MILDEKAPDPRLDNRPRPPEKTRSAANRRRVLSIAALLVVIAVTVLVTFYVRSCQEKQGPALDTPGNVAYHMAQSLKDNDFAAFQTLLTEEARLKIDATEFGALQKLNTDKALYGTYALVRLENGRLLMVYMTPPDQNGHYKIQDVKIVPSDMNELFNHAK